MINRKSPPIRFSDFSEDWEQHKLAYYLDVSKEKNENGVFNKQDVFSVSGEYGIVNQIEFQGRSFAGVSVAEYGVVRTGDVVYTKSPLKGNPYGIIKTNYLSPGIVSTLYAIYKPKRTLYSPIIQTYFERDIAVNNYLRPLVNKGAKNDMKVNNETVLKGSICLPYIREQKEIVKFFESLNILIVTQRQELENMKQMKQGFLQKMFPKEGETVPEIRFPGFTDDWERRKLSEMVIYKNGKGNEDKQSENGKYELINLNSISINGGLKHSGKFVDEADETLLENDLVMVLSDVGHGDLLGRVAVITENDKFVLNQRVALLRVRESAFPLFLFSYINHHQKYFKTQGAGMSQLNISKSSVEDFTEVVPKIKEQQKIGIFFKKIDDAIAFHQQELDLLKQTKKAFMQKMFI